MTDNYGIRVPEDMPGIAANGGVSGPNSAIVDGLEWVALAVASGVLGNLATEVIRKLTQGRGTPDAEDAVLLAKLAVTYRCNELGIPAPTRLTVVSATRQSRAWHLELEAQEQRFLAKVINLDSTPDVKVLVAMPK